MSIPAASALIDPARLAALRKTALLDSPPEEAFDRLTRLAHNALHTPVVLVTLVDADRQFFKSSIGLPEPWAAERETPLSYSFCQHAVTSGEPLVIEDAREHPLVRNSPAIAEMGMVAFAGMPLRTVDGHTLGVFCAADHAPHAWQPEQLTMLADFAAATMHEIQLRIALQHPVNQGAEELLAESPRFRLLVEESLAGVYLLQDGRFHYVNPRLAEIFGYSREEIVASKTQLDLVADQDRARVAENIRDRQPGRTHSLHYEFRGKRKDGALIDVEVHGTHTEINGRPAVFGTLLDITDRKQREAAIRRSEQEFRVLTEKSWDIIFVQNADTSLRYVSPSVERVLGYTPEEVIGRSGGEFIHPDDFAAAGVVFQEDMHHPGTQRFLEVRLRHKDGSWRTVEIVGQIVADAAGEPIAILNAHDITEQKQAQEALRRSEERYELVARATSDIIWDWNVASGELAWNKAVQTAFRYRPEQVRNTIEWWYNRIHPEDRERVVTGMHAAVNGIGDVWSDEYRFQRGDGSYAAVLDRGYVVRNERSEPVRMIGSMVDITARKREEEAQRFLAQASALLDSSLDPDVTLRDLARLAVPTLADYCLIDLVAENGGVRRVAIAHADPRREPLLHKDEYHLPNADAERHPVVRVSRTGQPVLIRHCTEEVLRTIAHDAEHHKLLLQLELHSFMIVPLVAREHTLGAITLAAAESGRSYSPVELMTAQDLARRAAVAIDTAQMYDNAQRAIRARDEVLAVVSHDLRNPLNAISMGATALVHASTERRTSHTKYLKVITRAAEQANAMINNLLDVSSIESGHFGINPSAQDVAALVKQACELHQPVAEARSIRLLCKILDDVASGWADGHQLQRVLSNLLSNAVKFTPRGGAVTLRAERFGEDLQFSVSDTGPGIAPDQIPHVFDRYWQAKRGDRRGAGLGLSIAKGIVEAHGGRIWLESTPGKGATFFFTLPLTAGSGAGEMT